MLEGKLTLPAIYALNSTSDSWAQEVAARIKGGTATSGEIARLIEFSKENGGIEYAVEQMGLYKEKALDLLHAMPGSDVCEALEAYLDYVVYREK